MDTAQSEALSHILGRMATKSDIRVLEERMDRKLSELEARLTWRFYAGWIFLGALMTALQVFMK